MIVSPRAWQARLTRMLLGVSLFQGAPSCSSAGELRDERFVEPATGRGYRLVESRVRGARPQARPLLMVLHPYAYPAAALVRDYRLQDRAVRDRNWVMVVPEGTRDSQGHERWNASAACCGADSGGPDEVAFLRAVLADVERRTGFDRRRVFVLGVSNGAFLAHRLACDASAEVRAIVSIAGAGLGPSDAPCAPEHPVSVLHVHGVRDEVIQYAGGVLGGAWYPGARASLEPWLRFSPCRRTTRRRSLYWFGPAVEVETHACAAHRVELWTFPDGDHRLGPLRRVVPELLDFLENARASS